jgi:uncharacterized membrane-anchored protein
MTFRRLALLVLNLLAIVVCGGLGGAVGYGVIHALDLSGIAGALVAAVIGMVIATAAWAGGATLLRVLGLVR